MTDYDPRDEESPVLSGPAPTEEPDNPLVPVSLVATLTKAEIDQQIATAHSFPRSPATARDRMIGLATLDDQMAAECIYSVPRGGKQIRGPSIWFAEIVLSCWGNIRCAARVSHEDRIERYVEAEAIVHDLETSVGYVARARRRDRAEARSQDCRSGHDPARGSGGDLRRQEERHPGLCAEAGLAEGPGSGRGGDTRRPEDAGRNAVTPP